MAFLEDNHLLEDEQNGFRKKRACIDHIHTVSTIIRNRIQENKSTFTCFIDFQKAFDFIDRELLLFRLLKMGINGYFYSAIQSIYKAPVACVKLNEHYTSWFPTPSGVKQGDSLSPTLFAIFINDLAKEIKQLGVGIICGETTVSLLLYADDLIFMADNEYDLQKMLTCADQWCKKWRLSINPKKTEIMEFRKAGKKRSTYQFNFGSNKLQFTDKYKYLGLIFDEHMSFLHGTSMLADSASRALGGVIGKTKILRYMGHSTYTQLYQSCVCPILDYCSGVWGFRHFNKSVGVHNRAIRYFLGVHKFAPIAAVNGDMGWIPCEVRWKINVVNLWNRMLYLPEDRMASRIFSWDISIGGFWAQEMSDLLQDHGLGHLYIHKQRVDVGRFKELAMMKYTAKWLEDIHAKPKLRTYCQFKTEYECEKYVGYDLSKSQRSLCAQFRSGILPLHVETGRYTGTELDQRLCEYCELGEIEDETHFLLYCPFYHDLRKTLFDKVHVDMSLDSDWVKYLFDNHMFAISNFIHNAWSRRKSATYA